ncbi:hypothetical protein [uncultured Sanguibacteroides sp.]|nr:hypothetical protein [uncultured Sanguibacteroides sp.]
MYFFYFTLFAQQRKAATAVWEEEAVKMEVERVDNVLSLTGK